MHHHRVLERANGGVMRGIEKFGRLSAFGLLAVAVVPLAGQNIDLKQYEVPVYTGRRALPDFTGSGARYRNFRTRITMGFRANAIAMGHYTVVTAGCGTSCKWSWVGDVRSGKIFEFPLGGESYPGLEIITAPNSRIVMVRWSNVEFSNCTTRLYSFNGARFRQVAPDRHKETYCSDA